LKSFEDSYDVLAVTKGVRDSIGFKARSGTGSEKKKKKKRKATPLEIHFPICLEINPK